MIVPSEVVDAARDGLIVAVAHDVPDHDTTAALVAFALRNVADQQRRHGQWMADNRKKGWKGEQERLALSAADLEQVADELDAVEWVGGTPAPAPPADSDAPRCASFRRATPDDTVLCTLPRGHEGDHGIFGDLGEEITWPREHTGAVCGDVITNGDTALNCALPLGHDGDIHWSEGVNWPRGTNPRAWEVMPERPDVDYPGRPGDDGPVIVITETAAPEIAGPEPLESPHTDMPAQVYPGMCGDVHTDGTPSTGAITDTCMLPGGHTGIHIGYTSARWAQAGPVEAPAAIPAPRVAAENLAPAETKGAVAVLERPAPLSEGHDPLDIIPPSPAPLSGLIDWSRFTPAAPAPFAITATAPRPAKLGLVAPGEPRARLSVSAITTMEDCGLKYRFTYRDQLPQTPAWWNVGGTAFHETVRVIEGSLAEDFTDARPLVERQQAASRLFAARFAAETEKEETASGVASQSWRAADKGKEDGAWWREHGDDMARAYVIQRDAWIKDWRLVRTLTGGTAQEIEFNHQFGGVMLKGFIDDLWVHRHVPNRVMVRDSKAGKRAPESDFQLETYGEVVKSLPTELAFTAEPLEIRGTYYLARQAKHTEPTTLGGNAEMIGYRAQMVAKADAAGIFMPRPSSFCGSCPFKSKCPAVK